MQQRGFRDCSFSTGRSIWCFIADIGCCRPRSIPWIWSGSAGATLRWRQLQLVAASRAVSHANSVFPFAGWERTFSSWWWCSRSIQPHTGSQRRENHGLAGFLPTGRVSGRNSTVFSRWLVQFSGMACQSCSGDFSLVNPRNDQRSESSVPVVYTTTISIRYYH